MSINRVSFTFFHSFIHKPFSLLNTVTHSIVILFYVPPKIFKKYGYPYITLGVFSEAPKLVWISVKDLPRVSGRQEITKMTPHSEHRE